MRHFRLKRTVRSAAAACALLAAAPAGAACWASASGVNFGVYDPQAAGPSDAAGAITVECDRREHSVTVSIGTGISGNYSLRTMLNGPDSLQYNLFADAAHTQVWGDGTSGTGIMNLSLFPNRPIAVPAYGRMPPAQNVSAGTYSDTLIVTIEY